mgnify:FL=1
MNLSDSDLTGAKFKNTKLVNSKINNITFDEMPSLILDHTFQNTIEPVSQSLGYTERVINKIFDKYILNSI